MLNPFTLPDDAVLFEPLIVQTIRYLKKLASIRSIPNYSRLTKQELVFALTPKTAIAA
jgi:Rho termination factor, N-terminal domain